VTRLLVAIYFIETGLLLIVVPWTEWWQRNFFADYLPWLQPVMAWPAIRAVVVATGLVTALAGLSDMRVLLYHRLGRRGPLPEVRPPEL
jgi:hypothetical protein